MDPLDPSVDLCIIQLGKEGTVETAGPQIHPHCHLPPPEWLKMVANEGPRPSTCLVAATGRHRAGVAACGCLTEPHRTPSWVEGWDGYL
jgi:hypothetical protein